MNSIGMIGLRFDTAALQEQLAKHFELWNSITHRTSHPASPHREVDDIWLRYNSLENFHGDMSTFNGPHTSVWYDEAKVFSSAQTYSEVLANHLKAKLGGVLITRIPSGKQVYPHVDSGWHAGYYEKFIIQIAANHEQSFCYDDGEFKSRTGDCYWFKNNVSHWVKNPSAEDRISLIVCLRRESCH